LHFSIGKRVGLLKHSVGQRTLPMVDMGNNAEISNIFHQ